GREIQPCLDGRRRIPGVPFGSHAPRRGLTDRQELSRVRIPLIIGNWKMNTTPSGARALARELVRLLGGLRNSQVAVAPPYTSLSAVSEVIGGSALHLAAQDVHWEDRGSFTGAVSHSMLEALGCVHALVGHSERRIY